MSVATKNPFALLEAEGASRPPSPSKVPGSLSKSSVHSSHQNRTGPPSRGGHIPRESGKKTSKAVSTPTDAPEEPVARERQRRYDSRGNDVRGNNSRGNDGQPRGRGSRGGARGGRRQFDKHSQTGKIDSDKKLHQSWGGDDGNTELKTEQAATADAALDGNNDWAAASAPSAEWGTAQAPEGPTEVGPTTEFDKSNGGPPRKEWEPEEEDNTLTLDQYLADQREKELAIPKLEGARRANEGSDSSIWKDSVPIAKDEETYFIGKTKTAPKPRSKKEEKVFLEIEAHFPERGGRGRGGRGGRGSEKGRAVRGRGGPRGELPYNVDVDDKSAFPSLS